ncbi:hypothetical protein TNCV_752581 [Trichonephila clavipes]|uniref:Uncharacterized protein n=1 Tax=Trichonephila clavipes TaxID=2585209 RepID=A0A8X6WAA6_TRICX|nr:hypothetical protein TNCV_752581 [Trichonephila clavipes]
MEDRLYCRLSVSSASTPLGGLSGVTYTPALRRPGALEVPKLIDAKDILGLGGQNLTLQGALIFSVTPLGEPQHLEKIRSSPPPGKVCPTLS